MNDKTNHTTKADFVEALNGEQTASTHDQLSLNVEPKKRFKKGHQVFLTDYGVECIITRYRQTKNVTSAAQAAGISYATLNRILRKPKHANHAALAAHLPTPRRNGSPEYLADEKEIARVYQGMLKIGASNGVILKLLRDIDFKTSSGNRAVDMSDHSLTLHCREFFDAYDFEESVADEPDEVESTPIFDQVDPTDIEEMLDRLQKELGAIFQVCEQLINCNDALQAYHYAQTIYGMIYKASIDVTRYCFARRQSGL